MPLVHQSLASLASAVGRLVDCVLSFYVLLCDETGQSFANHKTLLEKWTRSSINFGASRIGERYWNSDPILMYITGKG